MLRRQQGVLFRFWAYSTNLDFLFWLFLFLALGLPVWGVILVAVAMAILKYFIFQKKAQPFYRQSGLNWTEAIADGKQASTIDSEVLSSLPMLKGITSSVKRRSYLDAILKRTKKDKEHTWYNLYLRAFLRSGDYFALSLTTFCFNASSYLFGS